MAALAWRSGTSLVQAEAPAGSAWKLARVECGSSSVETMNLAERLVRSAEVPWTTPGGLVRLSAACRLAVDECAARLEGEAAEVTRAIGAIWDLCEATTLDEPSRRSARLLGWLRLHGVDWATEDDEYHAVLAHLRRLQAEGSVPPETWRPEDLTRGPASSSPSTRGGVSSPQQRRRQPAPREATSPFWQLTLRLLLRGRCQEAWTVLETHSTRFHRGGLDDEWSRLGALLREAPQPPTTTSTRFEPTWLTLSSSSAAAPFDAETEREALAEEKAAYANYFEARRRWKRRVSRLRAQLLAGDLGAKIRPLKVALALLDEGPDSSEAAATLASSSSSSSSSKPLASLPWEERLLATLLYGKGAWSDVDLRAWLKEDESRSTTAGSSSLVSAARRGLLTACLSGDALAATKALYEVGGDVACGASAFALANIANAAGKLGSGPTPARHRRHETTTTNGGDTQKSRSDGDELVAALGRDLAERLESTSAVESPWRLAIRVLDAAKNGERAVVSALRRAATPTSDADAVHLGRARLRFGLVAEARVAVASRGAFYLAAGGVDALRKAAFWFARAELCVAASAFRKNTPSTLVFAADGHAERLCASTADALKASLEEQTGVRILLLEVFDDDASVAARLADARAVVAGIYDGVLESSSSLATTSSAPIDGREASFLRRYASAVAGLVSPPSSSSATPRVQLRDVAAELADLLLDAPPPRREFVPHLLVLVLGVLRRAKAHRDDDQTRREYTFSSRATLGLMHRLVECQNAALDYDLPLDAADVADLRAGLAEALAAAYIAENRKSRNPPPATPAEPPRVSPVPRAFALSAGDLLGGGHLGGGGGGFL